MLPSTGFGASEGADMLQSILKQKAEEAFRAQQVQQEQQRIALESQKAQQQAAYQTEALRSLQDERAATAQLRGQQAANALTTELTPGSVLDPQGATTLRAGNLGSLIAHQGATLPSTAISGIASAGAGAPMLSGVTATEHAGHPEQDVYTGTAAQRQSQDQQKALRMIAMQDPSSPVSQWIRLTGGKGTPPAELFHDRTAENAQRAADREDQMRLAASLRPAPQGHFSLTPGVGPDGKPAMFRVNAQTGESTIVTPTGGGTLGKPPSVDATTANRLQSAKAVTQTGDDIVRMLTDPKIAAELGPAMSRYNSVADFVGNPPDEFSKLAGMIESYSLANMGVHGMRSNTGAEAIKKTLGLSRHTPESMANVIQGLNGFANHLLENNGQGAAPASATSAPKQVRYDLNGNPIK